MDIPNTIPPKRAENISKIFQEDGRTVLLAIDHGYFQGPTTGLENPRDLVDMLGSYCDAISPTRGVCEYCIPKDFAKPIVLRVSGGNSMADKPGVAYVSWLQEVKKTRPGTEDPSYWSSLEDLAHLLSIPRGRDLSNEVLTCTPTIAKQLGAVGVSVSIYVGAEHETQTIKNLADMATEAHRFPFNLAVLGITAVGENLDELRVSGKEKEFARYLALASRIAFEHGADIVKTYYVPGGYFAEVVAGCPVPIVIAGGKKINEFVALQTTHNAIQEGASGVDWGRNVFQSQYAVEMIQAISNIVHKRGTPEGAAELYRIPIETKENKK